MNKLVLLTLSIVLASGCTFHYREASTGSSLQEVEEGLVRANDSKTNANLSLILEYVQTKPEAVQVFFSKASTNPDLSPLGPIHTVTPLDASFVKEHLGLNSIFEIQDIKVYFVVVAADQGYIGAFIFEIKSKQGSTQFKTYTNVGTDSTLPIGFIDEDSFEMELKNESGMSLGVVSFDIEDEELQETIQLQIYSHNLAGDTVFAGQISSLEGF